MNTQVTIDVNGDPRQILECAYDTLLSMKQPSTLLNVPDVSNYIDPHLLFARVCVEKRFNEKRAIVCLVVVRQINDTKCELSFTADTTLSSSPGKGNVVVLMSEFLQLFSQNYYSPAQPQP